MKYVSNLRRPNGSIREEITFSFPTYFTPSSTLSLVLRGLGKSLSALYFQGAPEPP
jgi:hypothetical protein